MLINMLKIEIDHNLSISYKQHKISEDNFTLLFLHGLMSDKNGAKSQAIEEFAIHNGYNFVAFDNLGHGESDGIFTDYSIASWREATRKLIEKLNLQNIILIGSSMGGWLSILLGMEQIKNLKAIILLAPAPDFTKKIWENFTHDEKNKILGGQIIKIKKTDEWEGIAISHSLIHESANMCLMHQDKISISVPLTIIHGMQDEDVDYKISIELIEKIENEYATLKILKNSGHRLSSPSDLNIITNSISELCDLLNKT